MAAEGGISVAVLGSTGLLGAAILQKLLASPAMTPVHTLTRRAQPASIVSSKLQARVEADTATWASVFPQLSPRPAALVSALGTTRAIAGGLAEQRRVDFDLNLEIARAAHAAGVETYVLVSSGGSSSTSIAPYMRLKGEIEDAVKALGFRHTVILRPGLLVGDRTDSRPAETVLRYMARGLAAVSPKLTDFWAQDVETIGRAATVAIIECVDGKRPEGVWVMDQAEIVRLGKPDAGTGSS